MKLVPVLILLLCLMGCKTQNSNKMNDSQTLHAPKTALDTFLQTATIYEVNIRQYSPEGTFAAFMPHLERLKDMGADILWLMPIHPIGKEKRKGNLGSYYSISDYKGINPEFGSAEDFQTLVNKVHELDMKIIIDWVANHSAWDHPWMEKHPNWYTRNEQNEVVSPVEDWSDVADLNFENSDMRDAMTDAMEFWLKEYNIDGFRCDVAGMVPLDFWENTTKRLQAIKPVIMLAESEEVEHHNKAFQMTYAWEMHHLMNDIAKGNKNVQDLRTYLKKDERFPDGSYRMMFTTNHDENTWNGTVFERMKDAHLPMFALCASLPGMPLVYSGQEAANEKRLAFFEKDEIDWSRLPLVQEYYKTWLNLRNKNQALHSGPFGGPLEELSNTTPNKVFSFTREKNGDRVIVVLNLSPTLLTTQVELGDIKGPFKEFKTGSTVGLNYVSNCQMEPWEVRVLTNK